jgi:hypothetical protein
MKRSLEAARVPVQREYVAEYSWTDRSIALAMAIFFGALLVFFLLRADRFPIIVISAVMFSFTIFYLLHVTGTRIQFSKDGFVARISWFRHFSGRYDQVQRISSKPGTLKVEFADKRSLKFHPGLGDPDKVIAYLRARCPESVHLT